MMMRAAAVTMYMSWLAARLARSRCSAPIDWAHTTAPPVARAEKTLMMSTLIRSTSATLDTAASPAEDTIIMSAMPTMTARNCSMIRGIMSFFRACLLNTGVPSLWLGYIPKKYTTGGEGAAMGKTHRIAEDMPLAFSPDWRYNFLRNWIKSIRRRPWKRFK